VDFTIKGFKVKNILIKIELYFRTHGYFEFADWMRQYSDWKESKVNKYPERDFPKYPWSK
jgi:hypothetical protein